MEKEEKIFDTFIGLAAYAIKYPSENYTIYWQKLDEYEEDAILELLKATLIIDDQTQERINEIEAQRIERNNEKNKGKTPDFFMVRPSFINNRKQVKEFVYRGKFKRKI